MGIIVLFIGTGLWQLLLLLSLAAGIYLVIRDKRLSPGTRALWLILVIFFNVIAVMAFILWKMLDKEKVGQ